MNATQLMRKIKDEGLESMGLYYSCYKGQVSSNEDPDFRGRLKVICPAVLGSDALENWALSRGVYCGNGTGFYFIPMPGDPIWLTFEGGDPDYPIWEYGWFPVDYSPESPDGQQQRKRYMIQTPGGHRIVVDESNDDINQHKIYFQVKDGKVIEISKQKISLGTLGGSAEKAVLGDTLKGKLEDLIDQINQLISLVSGLAIVVAGAAGTVSPGNQTALATLQGVFDGIKNSLNTILSNVVTLD
jgi:hypothetical protein